MSTFRAKAALALDCFLVALVGAGVALAFLGWHFAVTPGLQIALPVAAALALILAVVVALRRAWRSSLRYAALALALGLTSYAILTSLFAGGGGGAAQAHVMSTQLGRATQTLLPQDYIVKARARQLQTPEAAFAYVRDNIRFESYQGILRGAQGTFQTRAGNALDRSMLLASILETNKVPVRIATGQLSAADAERLFARIFETAPASAAPAQPSSPEAAALKDRIFARAHRDYGVILAALGSNIPAVLSESHDQVIKEIQQHAWVQAQINGQWTDLDPSFPDSIFGHAYATADQTYSAPPPALMQQVTIRVTTETLANGALTKDTVLETSMPAYKIADSRVFLTYVQPSMQGAFGNKDVMEPAVTINGAATVGKAVNFGAGESPANAASSAPLSQAAGAFGTPAPVAANPNAPQFVSEWLEIEIAYPDGRKEMTRRVLVDRSGTAWRRAATLDPAQLKDLPRNADGLIATQTLYNMWFSAGKHDLLAFANSEQALLNGIIPVRDPASPTFGEQVWPLAIRDLSWFIASDHVLVPSINDTPGLRFYADSPRIFIWSLAPDPNSKTGAVYMESDLRRDTLRGIAKDPTQEAALAQHKLWFGALEGAMEHEMGAPPSAGAGSGFVSTSSLADAGSVMVMGPGAAPATATDPETQARLQVALSSGDTLVVPKQVLAGGVSGWWQIAHGTGDMRAVLADDLDGTGGYTPGGYGRGPIRARLPGGGGGQPRYTLPEDPEYYEGLEEELAGSVDIGEDAVTNEIAVQSAPLYKQIGAIVLAVVSWGYALFEALDSK